MQKLPLTKGASLALAAQPSAKTRTASSMVAILSACRLPAAQTPSKCILAKKTIPDLDMPLIASIARTNLHDMAVC